MKIKRYTAISMRAALAQVRAEQGPDAVILSSRRGEDGIEVIAAIDYDEALFVEMNRQRATAPAILHRHGAADDPRAPSRGESSQLRSPRKSGALGASTLPRKAPASESAMRPRRSAMGL